MSSMHDRVSAMDESGQTQQQQGVQQMADMGGWPPKRSPSSSISSTGSAGSTGGQAPNFPMMVAPAMPIPFGMSAQTQGLVVFPSQSMNPRGDVRPGVMPAQGGFYGMPVTLPPEYMRYTAPRGFPGQPQVPPVPSQPPGFILPRKEVQILPKPVDDEDDSVCDEDDQSEERKKKARNQREKNRAHLITDQIESLKRVLELSNFPLKSSSKYHVLAGCDEYIKQLKQKKKSLDLEAKLSTKASKGSETLTTDDEPERRRKALKYIEIVRTSHLALAVASMDGRLLLCNDKFCKVTGHSNDKLNGATIFSLAAFDALEEIFAAFARLLSAAHVTEEANPAFFSTATCKAAPMSGEPGYETPTIVLSLIRDETKRTRAFSCCLLPNETKAPL